MKVGFIGLGIMGRPMAKNLLNAGVELMVSDLNKEAVADVVEAGAKEASYAEIGEQCERIIIMVPSGAISKSILFDEDGVASTIKEGTVVCDMSSVTPVESKECYEGLKAKGVGIIFVTHFLEQVYEVCDKITVLRNGELVGEYDVENLPRVQLVAKMMGKDFDDLADIKSERSGEVKEGDPVIEAVGVSHHGSIKPFDITFNKGEVVGLTGLLGSGRSELVRAIYGADKADTGEVKVFGKKVKINAPLDAMKAGMAYLPEDRKKDGILADLSVRENIIIALQAKRGMFKPMKRKEMEDAATNFIKLLQIKTASMETPIKSLSGGNQQKVILGRWLLTNPRFLILDEPTRGIDIGTKTEIQKLVLRLADEGKSIAFISSEVEEMLRTCSRMAVLRDGKKVGEIKGDDLTQEKIMETIAGGDKNNE